MHQSLFTRRVTEGSRLVAKGNRERPPDHGVLRNGTPEGVPDHPATLQFLHPREHAKVKPPDARPERP